jgi:hypothetical protein
MKTRSGYSLAVLFVTVSLLLPSCAMPGLAPAATQTPTSTSTPKATATATPKPTSTPKPTKTPNLAATQQVDDFSAKVKEYYDAGYVSTTDGTYTHLDDYSYAWAKLNYYQWVDTGFSPTNFILKSDMAWTSASAAADSSGCGFVFRIQDNDNHYMAYISLKGYVEAAAYTDYWKSMGTAVYGNPARNGKATMTLIVEDNIFRVLVNNKLSKTYTGFDGKLGTGGLAYTILSGTNKSYGTQCNFKNTELWEIKS